MPTPNYVVSAVASSTSGAATTTGIDTTGCTYLLAFVSANAEGDVVLANVSDSKGNTWAKPSPGGVNMAGSSQVIFTCASPSSVGTSHTLTVNTGGNKSVVFIGIKPSAGGTISLDVAYSGASDTGSPFESPSIDPVDDALMLAFSVSNSGSAGTTATWSNSFSQIANEADGATYYVCSLAQRTAASGSINSSNTWSSGSNASVGIITFKEVASGPPPQYARPASDTADGSWRTQHDGGDLFSVLDETTRNDSDYAYLTAGTIDNLFTFSGQINDAAWSKSNSTVTANTVLGPEGQQDADVWTENATASVSRLLSQAPTIVAGAELYVAAELRQGVGTRHARVQVASDSGANGFRAYFNLTTGEIAVANAAFGTGAAIGCASIAQLPNGWWLVSCAGQVAPAATSILAGVFMQDTPTGSAVYNGDGTSGLRVGKMRIGNASNAFEVALGALTDPAVSTGHILRYVAGGKRGKLLVTLKQGASTFIAARAHLFFDEPLLLREFTLTATEADRITNYSTLRLRFEALE